LPKLTGILMFPAMLLGPCLAGITLARIVDGEDGIWDLFSRMCRWRFPARWYATLLIPPVLVLTVLFLLETFVSPVYAPNRFLVGIWFGVPAGFQGYCFARPTKIHSQHLPSLKLNCLRLLGELQKPELEYRRIEDLIRSDVALTYKLLRYVNSALLGRRERIQSIEQALMIVGSDEIRRWVAATLPMLATDKPGELATLSIVRARFCERLIRLAGIGQQNEAFLMGMFSLLDALIRPASRRSFALRKRWFGYYAGFARDRTGPRRVIEDLSSHSPLRTG
jgi:HDOD domain